MKTSQEYKDLLDAKRAEVKSLTEGHEGETPTKELRESIDNLMSEIEDIKGDIERAERVEAELRQTAKAEKKAANAAGGGKSTSEERELDKIAQDFRVVDYIRALYGVNELDGQIREMHEEGEKEIGRLGVDVSSKGLLIPSQMLTRMNVQKRATVTENTTTGVDQQNFVQAVYADTVLDKLGATKLMALRDARYPIIGAVTTQWEGETDANTDGGNATTAVNLTPKRLSSYVAYSKQAALQANYSVEQAHREAFVRSIAAKFEYATFTDDSGNGAFNYLGNGKTPVTGATATALVNALEEELLGNNHLRGNVGFVISHSLFAEFRTAVLATGVSALIQNNTIDGYPFYYSTQVADIASGQPATYCADWSKVVCAQFGGIELLLDPYSGAKSGQDQLVMNSFWDMAVQQDAAVSVGGYTG